MRMKDIQSKLKFNSLNKSMMILKVLMILIC